MTEPFHYYDVFKQHGLSFYFQYYYQILFSLNDEFMTSLSGDVKMAVICDITLSTFYLEEMKSTLLFACRTKLVKVKAQVNEVLDDQSLIHCLQCELGKAYKQQSLSGNNKTRSRAYNNRLQLSTPLPWSQSISFAV